jgi:3D (Asp-Asp-Asp) domain-containing protein
MWVLAACTIAAAGACATACVHWMGQDPAEDARRRRASADHERAAAPAETQERPAAPEARGRRERPAALEERDRAEEPAPAEPRRYADDLRPAVSRRRGDPDEEEPPPPRARRFEEAYQERGSRDADPGDDRLARDRARRERFLARDADARDADEDADLRRARAHARADQPARRTALFADPVDDPPPEREDPPPRRARVPPPAADLPIGGEAFELTYYDFPAEGEGARDATLYDAGCAPLAAVTRAFHDRVCVQGSGRLASGATVSFARRDCACAEACPRTGQHICFDRLDPSRFPHGRGAMGKAITPLATVAVDPAVIPLGTRLFITELAGLPRPDGSLHDGCFLAEDRGLRVLGRKIDVFTGDHRTTLAWSVSIRPGREVHVLLRDPRCDAARPRP